MDIDKLREFATRYTAAWCSQDAEGVSAFYAKDGSLAVNDDSPAVGRDAITEVAQGFMTAFPDMAVHMDAVEIQADQLIYRWTLTGTNTGPVARVTLYGSAVTKIGRLAPTVSSPSPGVISMMANTGTNSNTALEQAGRSTGIVHTAGLSALVLVSAYC